MKPPTNLTVVSNNCWGAEFYKEYNVEFLSPFVGLYIYPECYLKILSDPAVVLKSPLRFVTSSRFEQETPFPIGLLHEDVEIHFMHYDSEDEALSKWTRRVGRMDKNPANWYVKMDDREGASKEDVQQFLELPYPNKVALSTFNIHHPNHVKMPREKGKDHVVDGLKLYNQGKRYWNQSHWFASGEVKPYSWFQRIFH